MAASAGFWTLHQVCEALVPVAIGLIIDRAVSSGDGSTMIIAVLGLFGLFIALTMGWRWGLHHNQIAQWEEAHHLRLAAIRRVLSPAGITTTRQSGELLSITSSDTDMTVQVMAIGARVVSAVAGVLVVIVVMVRIDLVLCLVVVIGVPLLMAGLQLLGPLLERRSEHRQQTAGLAASLAADFLRGLRPLRGFGGETAAIDRYRTASRASLSAAVGAVRTTAGFLGATTVMSGLLLALVGGLAGWFALQGSITVGQLITVVGLAAFVSDPVLTIAHCVHMFAVSRASAARVAELLSAPIRGSEREPRAAAGPLRFAGAGDQHVPELDFTVGPGEILGLVITDPRAGDRVVEWLTGRRAPASGAVWIGEQEISRWPVAELRSEMLVEPHLVTLFGDTLRSALTEATGEAPVDPDRLAQVLSAASAEELGADDGLSRPLLDHGANLSGGQRQRLALARALLAERPLLVLRDPSTAVDAVTEAAVATGIRQTRSRPDRGTLLLTSSPPLLSACDRVILVDGARTREGSHLDLLHADPGYAEAVLR
ncbi:MAG: ABC transporter transmembrane domain-containing protein [Propionibacteriaceae bacterium]